MLCKCSPAIHFSQPPLPTLLIILPHVGVLTVQASWICVLPHLKLFTHQSAVTYEASVQELNQIRVVLILYWVSVIFLMQLADSYIWHTSFPIYTCNMDFTVFTVISTDVFHLWTPSTMPTKQDMIPSIPHTLSIHSHILHTNQLQYYYMS